MSLLNILVHEIKEHHLQSLKDNEVKEGMLIEYKEKLPSESDSDKKEFLSNISSFANAAGGDILFGVKEKRDEQGQSTGTIESLKGLPGKNIDAEKLRLENMVRDGVEPRIPRIVMQPIRLANKNEILLIRVSKSWCSPHMVTFKNYSRFYCRNSAGKYQLDVYELKSAFLISETASDKIRNFRIDRIGKMMSGDTPITLSESNLCVLHLVPLESFSPGKGVDIRSFENNLPPRLIGGGSRKKRYNFDGILFWDIDDESGLASSYLQIFHNGIFEAVHIRSEDFPFFTPNKKISITKLERAIIKTTEEYLGVQERIGINPPIFFMLSLLGISNYSFFQREWVHGYPIEIERQELIIPEVIIDDLSLNLEKKLKQSFDFIWNAAGFAESQNYVESKWVHNKNYY